jgi:hypothetical protein
MPKKRKRLTAKEFMDQLNEDSEWVRKDADRRTQHQKEVDKLKVELAPEQVPLISELNQIGLRVESVWDLVNTRSPYPAAIPVLLKHLLLAKHPVLVNGIARALTVREAKGIAAPAIIGKLKLFKNDPETRLALANALTVVAIKDSSNEIKTLIADEEDKGIRKLLERALKKS